MRVENKRLIIKKNIGKTIVEDDIAGVFLIDQFEKKTKNLGFTEHRVLDYSNNGKIILLNSKKWITNRNLNKTSITVFDIVNNKSLFTITDFLAYRSIIDNSSSNFLLEYYNGLCLIDINSGEIKFKKNKIDITLYNSDLHKETNIVLMPTSKNSVLTFDFKKQDMKEIRVTKISNSSWVKFDTTQKKVLISDKENSLHCFELNSFNNPIWSINFSKFGENSRIWCYKIITTESNLGCVHGFNPNKSQNPYCGGILYIFDLLNGEILDEFDYSIINQDVVTDFEMDKIILDDLSAFSLSDKKKYATEFSALINDSTT